MMLKRFSLICVASIVVVACSSSEPMAVEFVASMDPSDQSVVVTGPAVDEGLVCADGTVTRLGMEDMDGNPISDEQGVVNWEEAMESGATLEVMVYEEVNCGDGSGSFVIEMHNVVQPSALDYEGTNDVGTWVIDGGTGDYEKASGDGDADADFGLGAATFSGEFQSG